VVHEVRHLVSDHGQPDLVRHWQWQLAPDEDYPHDDQATVTNWPVMAN